MIHLFFSLLAFAYIPPTSMILKRACENSGVATYAIEQELQTNLGEDTLSWKESWIIENERTMRLTVSSPKDSTLGSWSVQYVYSGGQRWNMNSSRRTESQKIPDDFIERWFHFRNPENMYQHMLAQKILLKSDNKESNLRLARSMDVVNYAFGEPTPESSEELKPGLWIEQDQFLVRKLRLGSRAEVTAENYAPYAKALQFPKLRVVTWKGHSIQIKTLSIVARSNVAPHLFQASSLDQSTSIDGLQNLELKKTIEEFYTRFR